jgi:hypothetical protein
VNRNLQLYLGVYIQARAVCGTMNCTSVSNKYEIAWSLKILWYMFNVCVHYMLVCIGHAGFSVSVLCTGLLSTDVDIRIQLNVTATPPYKPLSLIIRRKKACLRGTREFLSQRRTGQPYRLYIIFKFMALICISQTPVNWGRAGVCITIRPACERYAVFKQSLESLAV